MAGAFFLISNVAFILGAFVFVEPILSAPECLSLVSENRAEIVLGALLEIISGLAYIGIAVLMFPVLTQRFASVALASFGLRIVEFVMQILADLSPMSMLQLSEEFVSAGSPASSAFQAAGSVLLAQRYRAFQMVSVALGLGALLLYTMFYRMELSHVLYPSGGCERGSRGAC
jgi:hypothetical protein